MVFLERNTQHVRAGCYGYVSGNYLMAHASIRRHRLAAESLIDRLGLP